MSFYGVFMERRCISLFLLLLVSVCFAVALDQTISIKNNTNQTIGLNLTVPEYTVAVITMTKLNSAQEMLHKAILDNSAEGVKKAVANGANVNQGKDGKSPLLWAVILKRSNAVEALLECNSDPKVQYLGHPIIHHSINANDPKSASLLIKYGADFSGNVNGSENVMDYAIRNKQIEMIQELINHGWNIHNDTDGYVGACSLNAKITNVWRAAIYSRSKEVIKLFIKNGANPNQVIYQSGFKGASWTPLLLAIELCDKEAVKILLDAGANVNQVANPRRYQIEHHTPLSFAMEFGCTEIVELLLERGANL